MPALWKSALDLIFPRVCAGCGKGVGSGDGHLCWTCFGQMSVIADDFCSRCGDPVEGVTGSKFLCSFCRKNELAFVLARSVFRHRGPVRSLVHAFKYAQALHLRGELAGFLKACVETHYRDVHFDLVTAVPLHPKRERTRTYNQAWILADALGRLLRVESFRGCLERVRDTETQTDLDAYARRKNVRSAFRAVNEKWICERRFLLVDDVMTTGATVNECAKTLSRAGAASVHVVTVARG